ncbi:MAG: homing endonuclease associated repeat-containing protein [Candidatus Angelobacter sp.]
MLITSNIISKEEITAKIKELAGKLGRPPRFLELNRELPVGQRRLRKLFGTYTQALCEGGCNPQKAGGSELKMHELFEDWAAVTRKAGRIPTINEYENLSRYSQRPLKSRFKAWDRIPAGMLEYGDAGQLWTRWEDVRQIVSLDVDMKAAGKTSMLPTVQTSFPAPEVDVKELYGEPLTLWPMAAAPVNELGVVFLFGVLARELGFVVLRIRPGFPDCIALRRLENGRWQWVRIEFEFESRNFLAHDHDPAGCDLIVCWEHNWANSPVEAIELKSKMEDIARIAPVTGGR